MDFTLTDGQKKLVSAFRTFGADTFTPERVAKWCRDQGLPDTVMKEFVDLYYETAEPDIAPDLAHSLLSQVLIVEELSRCAGTTLPFQNDLFNLQIMSGFAGAAEAASIAEDYRADGRLMFALAISEPDGGSDTMAMKTSCQTVDGRLLLERAQVLREQRRVRPLYIGGRHRQGRGGYGPLPVAVLLARAAQRARHQRRAHQQDRPVHAALRAHLLRRCGAVPGVASRCERGRVPAAVPSAGIRARASCAPPAWAWPRRPWTTRWPTRAPARPSACRWGASSR